MSMLQTVMHFTAKQYTYLTQHTASAVTFFHEF